MSQLKITTTDEKYIGGNTVGISNKNIKMVKIILPKHEMIKINELFTTISEKIDNVVLYKSDDLDDFVITFITENKYISICYNLLRINNIRIYSFVVINNELPKSTEPNIISELLKREMFCCRTHKSIDDLKPIEFDITFHHDIDITFGPHQRHHHRDKKDIDEFSNEESDIDTSLDFENIDKNDLLKMNIATMRCWLNEQHDVGYENVMKIPDEYNSKFIMNMCSSSHKKMLLIKMLKRLDIDTRGVHIIIGIFSDYV